MLWHTAVDIYSLSATIVFVVAKHLTLITTKWIRYVYVNFVLNKVRKRAKIRNQYNQASHLTHGKIGILKMNLNVFLGFLTP